jgi:L-threonylcarbamoyladenylate synthase
MGMAPILLSAPDLARVLADGGAAIFPTDTLPALASLPEHAGQLWQSKQRSGDKPLILMGAEPEGLLTALGVRIDPRWRSMAARCWPGAVTLVLPATGPVAEALHPGGASLGLRVPACSRALELLAISGPLATTSCNRSGQPPCLTPSAAAACFPELPCLAPLPWGVGSGIGSTVLAWQGDQPTAGRWQVLRRGAVMPAALDLS